MPYNSIGAAVQALHELPDWDPERSKAQAFVDEVYASAWALERVWERRLERKPYCFRGYEDGSSVIDSVDFVTDFLGEKPVKVVLASRTIPRWCAGAAYHRQRSIHFASEIPEAATVVHELTHIFFASGHDQDFVDGEDLVFKAFGEWCKIEKERRLGIYGLELL